MGSVAAQHVGSSWTRGRTCVPCIGKQTLNPWTTREDPEERFFFFKACVLELNSTLSVTNFLSLGLGLCIDGIELIIKAPVS